MMGEILWKMFERLNMMKGYSGAFSSKLVEKNSILLQIDDKVYKLTLEDLGETELTSEIVDKYSK